MANQPPHKSKPGLPGLWFYPKLGLQHLDLFAGYFATHNHKHVQAVIFIGIQASGKSTFYVRHFLNSHVRISMDLLNTRNKERVFLETCYLTQSRFVVDNTNPTKEERARYIVKAKQRRYEVVGYYFHCNLKDALLRNARRAGKAKVPDLGIRACNKKMQLPTYQEGFDKLYSVTLEGGHFLVKDWKLTI